MNPSKWFMRSFAADEIAARKHEQFEQAFQELRDNAPDPSEFPLFGLDNTTGSMTYFFPNTNEEYILQNLLNFSVERTNDGLEKYGLNIIFGDESDFDKYFPGSSPQQGLIG